MKVSTVKNKTVNSGSSRGDRKEAMLTQLGDYL